MERSFRSHICSRSAIAVALVVAGFAPSAISLAQDVDLLRLSLFSPGTASQTAAQNGFSVAVSAEFIVLGAPSDNLGGENSGSVKVYSTATGQFVHALVNPTHAAGDNFGSAVAVSGTQLIVGAPGDDTFGSDAGRAYHYDLGGATPTTPMPIDPVSPVAGARFGSAVAISGASAVVGAPLDVVGGAASGCAYVHDLAGVNPVTVLVNPSPDEGDWFGIAVGISGTRVIVGAQLDDTEASAAGRAYVFDLSNAIPESPVAVLPNPSPDPGDWFGCAVAISGSRAVVGALFDGADEGSAYLFDLDAAEPGLSAEPLSRPSAEPGEWFGAAVAISGSHVVVGAMLSGNSGCSFIYDLDGAEPLTPVETIENPTPAPFDLFGASVAVSDTTVVVGAYWDDEQGDDAGSVYCYEFAGGTPPPPRVLDAPAPLPDEWFGTAVAVSGSRVVVGAPGDGGGRVYLFDRAGAIPDVPVATIENPSPHADDRFGSAVAISGTRVVVGASGDDSDAPDGGRAYVYALDNANTASLAYVLRKPNPAAFDVFGSSVAISGERVVVGAFGDDTGAVDAGSAFVFDLASLTPTEPRFILRSPAPHAADWFGSSVAISGTRVAVGAFLEDTGALDAGSVFVFNLAGPMPAVPSAILRNPEPAADDWFGYSVGISGTVVAVGAVGDDGASSDAGAAYLYDLGGAAPTEPAAVLTKPDAESLDFFGSALAVSGTRVVVGAYGDDTGEAAAGSAVVFDLASARPDLPVAVLANPAPQIDDRFAFAVAIDDLSVVAGASLDDSRAPNQGAAYIFDAAPLVPVTGGGTEMTYTTARVSGFVNPGSRSTTVSFEAMRVDGPSSGWIAVAAEQIPLTGTDEQMVTATFTGLQPSATYRFHVVASNSSLPPEQAVWGKDVLFTTQFNELPVVTLAGDNEVVIEASPDAFQDPGATAMDTEDGPLTPVIISDAVVPGVAGIYLVTWGATDQFGAVGNAIRTVRVVDEMEPVFTQMPQAGTVLNGSAVPDLASLAAASDQSGGSVVITQNPPAGLLFPSPGPFTVTLIATDPSGNIATAPLVFDVASDDADGDGLLDSWEKVHFNADHDPTALDDFDRDGVIELLELAFGLDPKKPDIGSLPRVDGEGGYLTITLTKYPGVRYIVESGENVRDASFSSDTTTVLRDDFSTLKVRDQIPIGFPPGRFLRVRVEAVP